MKTVNAFVDTSTVNRILEIDSEDVEDPLYEHDRLYLSRIRQDYVQKGAVKLIVNPSVKQEIEKTRNIQKRRRLLSLFDQFHFIPYNKTVFPFTFTAHFITKQEKEDLQDLCKRIEGFEKDEKIFLDAVSSSQAEVLLTTDRKHLARIEITDYLKSKGLDKKIKVFTPTQFHEYLKKSVKPTN